MSNVIHFRKITEEEFNNWKDESIKGYAEDLVNAGQCLLEDGIKRATADFLVYSSHRGKGYGKNILNELEAVVKEQGINNILLHVFENNTTARELYKKVGYVEVEAKGVEEGSIYMKKSIN